MKIKNRLSPYPILFDYRDDYIGSSFCADIDALKRFNDIHITVKFSLKDDIINDLIKENKAAYMVHVECPSLSLRRKYESTDEEFSVLVNMSEVSGVIEICTFIVVKENLENYKNPHFHPDYQSVEGFNLCKGQLLAIGTNKLFDIEKSGDSLTTLPSILRIVKASGKQEEAITVSTDNPKYIAVGLREDVFELYARLGKKKFVKTSLSLVLLPAMMIVLQRMKEQEMDLAEFKWFDVIEGLLEQNGIEVQDLTNDGGKNSILSVAQAIFSDPVSRSLIELRNSIAGGE